MQVNRVPGNGVRASTHRLTIKSSHISLDIAEGVDCVNRGGPYELGLRSPVPRECAANITNRTGVSHPLQRAIQKWHKAAIYGDHVSDPARHSCGAQRLNLGQRGAQRLFDNTGDTSV